MVQSAGLLPHRQQMSGQRRKGPRTAQRSGYAFAAFADFASPPSLGPLELAFANLGVKIAAAGEASPTNVSVAGESEIHLARIEVDPNVSSGIWIWGVADNLRLSAVNAVSIAEELVAEPPVQ